MAQPEFSFTIYVGAPTLFGRDAFIRLSRLCHKYCGDHYSIEVVEVTENGRAAARADVDETPTIFVAMPGHAVHRLGNLAVTEGFLKGQRSATQSVTRSAISPRCVGKTISREIGVQVAAVINGAPATLIIPL